MKAAKFSKKYLRELIEEEIKGMEKRYLFTREIGWAQVDKRGEAINREYGKYDCLCNLLEIELS